MTTTVKKPATTCHSDAAYLVDAEIADGTELDAAGVGVESLTVPFVVLITTYISPVASEDIYNRPALSNARPTGLKQLLGHFELSWFATTSIRAVLLSDAATGSPLAN